MKIISWDVGIKNLAFCVIELNNDNTKKILHWNIINLIPDNEHCFISTCKKPVIKSCEYYGKSVCWCEKHESFYKTLQTISKDCPQNLTKPSNVKTINCNNINIDDLRCNMIYKLDTQVLPLVYTEKINYFLIENQPTLKNPRMKAIADTLYTWALIRCKLDSKITKSLHLINPSNKLKKYASELLEADNKYRTTKLKSIEVVKDYFEKNKLQNWINYLSNYSKKDDLCDAMLQGFYWIDTYTAKEQKEKTKKEKTIIVKTKKSSSKKKLNVIEL